VSFFNRLKAIVQAKANTALDAAEKPDEMLDLSYEKQTELLTRVRRGIADIATSKKRLELQADKLQQSITTLQG
jgi:phage shock protein A